MKLPYTVVGIAAAGIILAGCSSATPTPEPSPTPDTTAVLGVTNELSSVAKPEMPDNESSITYQVDPTASQINWSATKRVGHGHYGTVDITSGTILLDENQDNWVYADFEIDMTSMVAEDLIGKPAMKEKLEAHLRSDDFFSTDTYPTAQLQVTQSEVIAENQYQLTGVLTIKDISHEVSFPVTVDRSETGLTATGELTIDRSKWDVRYGSESFFDDLGDNLIENDVQFEVSITATRTE